MARTDTLPHFLTDVADAIREKKGTEETIQASDFDTEIENLPSGGSDLDWSTIGYNGTPQAIQDGYDYAVEIKNNWVPKTDLLNALAYDINLMFCPLIDTSIATTMVQMFYGDYSLISIPLLNTENVTRMSQTFNSCYSLETIPLINTSNVTSMTSMFQNCKKIKTIPLINTGKVTDCNTMFRDCEELRSVPLLDLSKATNVSYMFMSCKKLVDIPQFDFSSVTNMNYMYSQCSSLSDTSLDNILKTCIGAASYTGTKTLNQLGFAAYSIPASKFQSLPSYQDFLDAGWTIGY